MILNAPNILTLLRIVLLPVIVGVFYLPVEWSRPVCASIFALAGLTDWLDGYLARRLNQQSPFGAFLDPVADKLMVAVALVLLVEAEPSPLITVPAIIIIGREIVVSAFAGMDGRAWQAGQGRGFHVGQDKNDGTAARTVFYALPTTTVFFTQLHHRFSAALSRRGLDNRLHVFLSQSRLAGIKRSINKDLWILVDTSKQVARIAVLLRE